MGFVAIKCPSCYADIQLDETREFGFCNYCGTKVMQDKIVIEHRGSLKIDTSDELNNLYQLARRAKDNNNSEYAQKYYDQILIKDPNSWEANFYSTYFQAMNCKIADINSAAIRLINCEETILRLIKDYVKSNEEQIKAICEVGIGLIKISRILSNATINHYKSIDISIRGAYSKDMIINCCSSRDIVYNYGDNIILVFGESYGKYAIPCWKAGVEQHIGIKKLKNKIADKQTISLYIDKISDMKTIKSYTEKIKKYEPTYKKPKSGCYIATAVYGSYDCPEVWTLRRFRDYKLATTWYGRLFITLYYAISPTLVRWFGHTNWFKNLWREKLDRMIERLKSEGFKDTPYNDK